MMSKLTVSAAVLALVLVTVAQLGESKPLLDAADAKSSSPNMQPTSRRDQVAEALLVRKLLKELMSQAGRDVEEEDEDSSEAPELEIDFVKRGIEKRFPKWRTGDTRTRMHNLIDLNDFSSPRAQHGDYSHQLRRLWEKNMVEKNKMYQNLQNLYGRRK